MKPISPGRPSGFGVHSKRQSVGRAETPASLTVTPLFLNEGLANAAGAILEVGVMRTEPTWIVCPELPVTGELWRRAQGDRRTRVRRAIDGDIQQWRILAGDP